MSLAYRKLVESGGCVAMVMCMFSVSGCLEATDAAAPTDPASTVVAQEEVAAPHAAVTSETVAAADATETQTPAETTQNFSNVRFGFDSSSGNSANDAFESRSSELVLCPGGRFFMSQTSFFSSSAGGFSTEYSSSGSWQVAEQANFYQVVLNIEQTDEENVPNRKELVVEISNSNEVFVDGSSATVDDATADCG